MQPKRLMLERQRIADASIPRFNELPGLTDPGLEGAGATLVGLSGGPSRQLEVRGRRS